jgi:hypothetical protein
MVIGDAIYCSDFYDDMVAGVNRMMSMGNEKIGAAEKEATDNASQK